MANIENCQAMCLENKRDIKAETYVEKVDLQISRITVTRAHNSMTRLGREGIMVGENLKYSTVASLVPCTTDANNCHFND